MLTVLLFVVLVIVLLVIVCAGLSWYVAGRLLYRKGGNPTVSLVGVEGETVTLQSTKSTRRPGVFGISGPNGQAIIGDVQSADTSAKTVTRQLLQVTGELTPQTAVAWNTTVYGGKMRDQLNLSINDVSVPSSLGDLPAWFVSAQQSIWTILVHGTTGTREQGLRAFKTLHDHGLPILDISYRNDKDALASSDGLLHFGDTEWEDLEASVKYALEHGARGVILYGISLGGTIVELFLARSSYADRVRAVVLDSPVFNWSATLESQIKKNKLPGIIAKGAEWIIEARTGVRFGELNLLKQPRAEIRTLLFHGVDDTSAPIRVSDEFAANHSGITYVRVPDAEHTQCWNADSQGYEAQLRSFLEEIIKEEVLKEEALK